MGAITLEEVVEGGIGDSGTEFTVTNPATVNNLDLLVLCIATDSTETITEHVDWTELAAASESDSSAWIGYLICDGSEDGTNYTFNISSSETAVWEMARFSGWHGTTAPEVGTFATNGTGNADPPSLTPSWGAEDTNAYVAMGGVGAGSFSGAPTNYGTLYELNSTTLGGSGSCSIAIAIRDINGSPENPGTFTNADEDRWNANTIVVRPDTSGAVDQEPSLIGGKLVGPGILQRHLVH